MSSRKRFPGWNAGTLAEIMTAYPSIAAWAVGSGDRQALRRRPLQDERRALAAALGRRCVVADRGADRSVRGAFAVFGARRCFGKRYVLTNRSVVRETNDRRADGVDKSISHDIKQIIIRELPGQAFYKAADLVCAGGDGKTLGRWKACSGRPVSADNPRSPRRGPRSKSRSRRFNRGRNRDKRS